MLMTLRASALKYHPDRNPGREAAANSMFQTIQAAHEVLTDPEQRAKYDTMRLKNASGVRYPAYGSSSTSGTRGNPWSSAGSEWAPPPKPPPPRDSERRRPPPSSGAQRWNHFPPNGTIPNPNADAESRRQTYQAWERMRPQQSRARPSQSSREESSGYRRATSPKPSKPDYDGYRDGATHHSPRTSPSRSSSSRYSFKKASFMPGSSGGDEPSASTAYSNYRSTRASTAKRYTPEPPPRNTAPVDPLKQFRETASGPFEPRQSTPYATHGGEKTNPFEAINISRGKSTRIRSDKADPPSAEGFSRRGSNDRARSESPPPRHHRHVSSENSVPRADFDAKLGPSPKRNFSSTNRGAKLREHIPFPSEYPTSIHITSSSDSDDGEKKGSPDVKHRPYMKTRSPRAARPSQERQPPPEMPNGGKGVSGENTSKPTLGDFNGVVPSQARESDNFQPGDPSGSHSYSDPDQAARGGAEGGPKMYSIPNQPKAPDFLPFNKATELPTVVAELSKTQRKSSTSLDFSAATASSEAFKTFREPSVTESPPDSPSGVSFLTPPNALNSFEATQFKLLEQLVGHCTSAGRPSKLPITVPKKGFDSEQAYDAMPEVNQGSKIPRSIPFLRAAVTCAAQYSPTDVGSPCKKQRVEGSNYCVSHQIHLGNLGFKANAQTDIANKPSAISFSFETYFPSARRASNSVENISTTFSSEDWKGKFEAGDVFRAQASNGTDSRSGSRTRTRTTSPTKRPSTMAQGISNPVNEPHGLRGSRSADTPMMSSGGAKFNAEEWAKTFKPQTFAPSVFPPAPTSARSSRPIRRSSKTAGKGSKSASSTTINEEYDSPESESYIGKNTDSGGSNERPPIPAPSPNAMDIDPPLPSNEIPKTPTSNENKSGVFEKISSETRHVPLEPQPGWTTGGASGVNAKSSSTIPRQPGLASKQTNPAKPRRRATRSTDSDDFKTNFEDLQNVEPLYNQATGLNSFDDLASNLPFRSGASTKLQFPRDFSTGKLSLPPQPRPPMIPTIPPDAKRPSESSWQSYLAAFTIYMAKWNAFDTKMVNHFVGRQTQVTAMPSGWLGAIGDKAIGEYREGLKQDEEVRDYWRTACSKHQQVIEGFQWFRECMRDGVQKAGPSRERKNTA